MQVEFSFDFGCVFLLLYLDKTAHPSEVNIVYVDLYVTKFSSSRAISPLLRGVKGVSNNNI